MNGVILFCCLIGTLSGVLLLDCLHVKYTRRRNIRRFSRYPRRPSLPDYTRY